MGEGGGSYLLTRWVAGAAPASLVCFPSHTLGHRASSPAFFSRGPKCNREGIPCEPKLMDTLQSHWPVSIL